VFDTQKSAWKQFAVNNTDRFDDIPCILLYAQYDVRDIQESMLIWKNMLKNSKLIQLKNTGHNYFYDSYGKVNRIIEKFISDQETLT
ncbi:MAG: alpha/beta hydrolase, partial [Oscillospiraceae bacterium]|nr:alpha/beta hydrolase [Oscillospiraceae bacterium]